jgi:Ca2+-binding RTX toxin-like protein
MTTITGTAGNDMLTGTPTDDVIVGGGGADTIDGGDGNDTIYAGDLSPGWSVPWNDNPYIAPVLDTGTDHDVLTGGNGNDTFYAGYGDSVSGGADADGLLISFRGASAGVTADFRVFDPGGSGSMTIGGGTIQGIEHVLWIEGSNFDDTLTASADPYGYPDFAPIFGLGGNDHIVGGPLSGNLYGGDGDDTIDASLGVYGKISYGGAGNDTIYAGTGIAYGQDGNDIIWTYGRAWGDAGDDDMHAQAGGTTAYLWGGDGNDTLSGSANGDVLYGNAGADNIYGGGGNDILYSAGAPDSATGNDFDYGTEHDHLEGGAGDDTFNIGYGDDAIGGDGIDTLNITFGAATSGVDITIGDISAGTTIAGGVISGIEVLGATTGTAFADHISIGGSGSLSIFAGGGDDVITATGSGSASFSGGAGNDILTGGSGNDALTGDDGNDVISGGAGNDSIHGSNGSDTIEGGDGDDELWGSEDFGSDGSIDTVTYAHASGGVTVNISTVYGTATGAAGNDYLHNFANIVGSAFDDSLTGSYEANVLDGGDGNDQLYGREANDTLTGGLGNDTLDGGSGADAMTGGVGDDNYYVDDVGDTVTESAGQGTDTVYAAISYILGTNLERLTLTGTADSFAKGNALDNIIIGNSGNNLIDGGAGADAMSGGAGNDTYIVDNAGDTITEAASQGTDLVQSSITFTLGANLENLTLTGASAINGTGNAGSNNLIGNSAANILTGLGGNDVLDGGAGADTLQGGTGNDTYKVDNAGDQVVEATNEGTDLVVSSVSYTLGANVENLNLAGNALNGTGNALDNVIHGTSAGNTLVGLAGNDTLDGGAGADSMNGGLGDDTFYVDNASDQVIEAIGEGSDSVITTVSYALATDAEVEQLSTANAAGTAAIDLTGNNFAQQITGNAGDNHLNGGGGNDTLAGLAGDDVIDGGTGADTMIGGIGNDHYTVDNAGDVVVEDAAPGIDYVDTTLSTYTLSDNVEGLTFLTNATTVGTGNDLDNYIYGPAFSQSTTIYGLGGRDEVHTGAGNDVIDGGTGMDWMVGGAGNDTYYVDNAADAVVENANEGTDQIYASVSFGVFDNVENLTLTGADTIDGWGNQLNNKLIGNSAANSLFGNDGNDTLVGGGGNDALTGGGGADTLTGGAGNDTFLDTADGLNGDTITDYSAGERIVIADANLAGFTASLSGGVLTYTGGSLTLNNWSTGDVIVGAAAEGGVQITIVNHAVTNDFNGDGRSDVLWRNGTTGDITDWIANGDGSFAGNTAYAHQNASSVWHVLGTGDFNGDGKFDILWRNDNGKVTDWLGNSNGGFKGNLASADYSMTANWQVIGSGDFNGDGRDDILWQNTTNGTVTDWLANANGGFAGNAVANTNVGSVWQVAGTGDVNGDGIDDVIWRNTATGDITDWLGQANGSFVGNTAYAHQNASVAWHIIGVGDFNGDGRTDILLRNDNGKVTDWLGNANGGFSGNLANADNSISSAWHAVGIGDYNGDHRDDILWQNSDTGNVTDWLANSNGGFAGNPAATNNIGSIWHVEPHQTFI